MTRTGRILSLGCLLLALPTMTMAGGNSLLVPATARCALNALPEELPTALRACQQAASEGDAQAAFEYAELLLALEADRRMIASYAERVDREGIEAVCRAHGVALAAAALGPVRMVVGGATRRESVRVVLVAVGFAHHQAWIIRIRREI